MFLNNAFETAELWCVAHFAAIFKKLDFPFTFIFYCCLVKKGSALKVA